MIYLKMLIINNLCNKEGVSVFFSVGGNHTLRENKDRSVKLVVGEL
jgi:hypothetical protein